MGTSGVTIETLDIVATGSVELEGHSRSETAS